MPENDSFQPLLSKVRGACLRLADQGWRQLLSDHGLNIDAADLEEELSKPLSNIDRSISGFEDFALEGVRAIEPGRPAHSLLYHAFASPVVLTTKQHARLKAFPTLAEIEAVENYVFGIRPPSIQDIRVGAGNSPLAIVVFALEYRPAVDTVHQRHADLCFSRAGVCRVGTRPPNYLPENRGFSPLTEDTENICVLPCRYAAFVAAQYRGEKHSFGPMRFQETTNFSLVPGRTKPSKPVKSDSDRLFWVPVHKLYPGRECLRGYDLSIELTSRHINQKLRKIHLAFLSQGENAGWAEPDISNPPFKFSESIAEFSTDVDTYSWILTPVAHERLVEEAHYGGKSLTFLVPKPSETFSSSLNIPARGSETRAAPEYVHARHMIDKAGNRVNLNDFPSVGQRVKEGGYQAQHYIDYTGDGYITVECPDLSLEIPQRLPAYSLVAPPDFTPFVKQQDLMDWWQTSVPPDLYSSIWPNNPGPPQALSDERYPANLTLDGKFGQKDDTITTIVSMRGSGLDSVTTLNPVVHKTVSSLPDRAAGVFAPGWDISIDITEDSVPDDDDSVVIPGVKFLAAYGLGSPFPEDAKLCAALSSFWPAAAPDTTRVFEPYVGRSTYAVTTPLTDDVIGQTGHAPWDGISGPRLSTQFAKEVEFQSLAYGDWVEAALNHRFKFDRLARMTPTEYEARTLVMARVYQALGAITTPDKAKWCVLSFTKVDTSDPELLLALVATGKKLDMEHCYRFLMFQHLGVRIHPTEFRKSLVAYESLISIYADPLMVLKNQDNQGWNALSF